MNTMITYEQHKKASAISDRLRGLFWTYFRIRNISHDTDVVQLAQEKYALAGQLESQLNQLFQGRVPVQYWQAPPLSFWQAEHPLRAFSQSLNLTLKQASEIGQAGDDVALG